MGTFVCSVINRLSGPIFRFFGGRKEHIASRICSGFSGANREWCGAFLDEVCENIVGNYDPGVCEQACDDFCAGEADGTCGDRTCGPGEGCHNCETDCGACPVVCVDQDGDGYGADCEAGEDCVDNTAEIHPGASEICGNGVDEDCDGNDAPCVCGDGACQAMESCEDCREDCGQCDCEDGDGDGYGVGCPNGSDCNDDDVSVHPGADEICDGVDNNCNQHIDERLEQACENDCGMAGQALCLDGVWGACIAPNQPREVCNQHDDDCDGEIDEGLAVNACNGCGELPGEIDAACGSCGHWRCDGPNRATCDGDHNPDHREPIIDAGPWWEADAACLPAGVEVGLCIETRYSLGERFEIFIVEVDTLASDIVHLRMVDVECDDWRAESASYVSCTTWTTQYEWDGVGGGDPEYRAVVQWFEQDLESDDLSVHDGDLACD